MCPVCLVAAVGLKKYGKDAFGANSPGQALVCAPTGVLDFVCRKVLTDLINSSSKTLEPHESCRAIGMCLRLNDSGLPYPAGKDMPDSWPPRTNSSSKATGHPEVSNEATVSQGPVQPQDEQHPPFLELSTSAGSPHRGTTDADPENEDDKDDVDEEFPPLPNPTNLVPSPLLSDNSTSAEARS